MSGLDKKQSYVPPAHVQGVFIRVILNGRIRVRRGRGGGVVRARWRRGGHKGHASLKFEKDGSLAKRARGVPKSIANKKVRKLAQGGA